MQKIEQKNLEIINSFSWKVSGSPYLLVLVALYITFSILGTVLLYKLVMLGSGLLAPGGLFVLPFVMLIEDVIAEVYGYIISRFLIWLVFLSMIIFSLSTIIIIHLPSPNYWHFQNAFNYVFDPIKIAAPSLMIGLFISRFINIYGITKLKVLFSGKFFWLRSIISSLLGGFVGVAIIFTIAYWHSGVPFQGLKNLILTDYLLRILYAIFGGGPASIVVIFLKYKEHIDVYDIKTNFNPFRLSLDKDQ